MKRFSHSAELAYSAERIIARITTSAYLHFRYTDHGLIHSEIEILRDDDDVFECRVARVADTSGLPALGRKLLGHRVEFVQVHRWERQGPPYHGQLEIAVTGVPGSIRTELRLLPDGDNQSCFAVEGQIEARVPLLGGQIERMLASRAEDNFIAGVKAMQDFMAQQA